MAFSVAVAIQFGRSRICKTEHCEFLPSIRHFSRNRNRGTGRSARASAKKWRKRKERAKVWGRFDHPFCSLCDGTLHPMLLLFSADWCCLHNKYIVALFASAPSSSSRAQRPLESLISHDSSNTIVASSKGWLVDAVGRTNRMLKMTWNLGARWSKLKFASSISVAFNFQQHSNASSKCAKNHERCERREEHVSRRDGPIILS